MIVVSNLNVMTYYLLSHTCHLKKSFVYIFPYNGGSVALFSLTRQLKKYYLHLMVKVIVYIAKCYKEYIKTVLLDLVLVVMHGVQ